MANPPAAHPPGPAVGSDRNNFILQLPEPGSPLFWAQQRRFRFPFACESYEGQVTLAGRRRLQENGSGGDDDDNISATSRWDWRMRVINRSYNLLIRPNQRCGIEDEDDGEEIQAADNGERGLTEQVLSNHLIWHILGSHLCLTDLKICRLVSRHFNHHVLNSTNFKSRALITLTPHLLRREEFGTTQISWKHISLPVQRVCEKSECAKAHLHDLTWLIPMLSEVESLILLKGAPCPVNLVAESPSQTLMINESKKLKNLTVDDELLYYAGFQKCSVQLSRLQEFKIATATGMRVTNTFYAVEKMLNVTKNLRVFKSSFESDPREYLYHQNVKFTSLLMQQNAGTLEILKPRDPIFWRGSRYPGISDVIFPQLTTVRICVATQNVQQVIRFIKAQPKLTHLTLESFDAGRQFRAFPYAVLRAVADISHRLKKIDVKAIKFLDVDILDWKFLEQCSSLEDFSIWPWGCRLYADPAVKRAGFVPEVLKYLPPKVKRVRLQAGSVQLINSTGRNYSPQPIDLGRIDPEALTCLCLSRMASYITDTTLEYIFRNFLKLQKLHLSDLGDMVTEFGFIGVSLQRPQSEFSIENLKGLQSLTIRRCKAISNFVLLKAFRFQELRYLDLSGNSKINVQGCIAVAQQNPSLEVFMNDHVAMFPEESVRRKNFPRLKTLQNWLVGPDSAIKQ